MPLLDIQGLNVSIGATQILRSVSLSVAPGEILGIVGESGSGKSMTLLSAMRLLPNSTRMTGRVSLDGEDLTAKSEREMCAVRGKRIGMIFQEPMSALNPVQTIGAQVAEMFTLHRAARADEAMNAAEEQLTKVGLDAGRVPLDRYPHQLSGGQRQRVVVAMATALAPKLVLADEPTTALDVTTQAGILDLLKALARREGAGLVFVTHDLAVIAGLADRIAIMKDGEIVEEGAAPAIFRTMQHPYSKALRGDTYTTFTGMDKMFRTPISKANVTGIEVTGFDTAAILSACRALRSQYPSEHILPIALVPYSKHTAEDMTTDYFKAKHTFLQAGFASQFIDRIKTMGDKTALKWSISNIGLATFA
ncbi:MAG: ABC transporter ATP-binding protein, partial [Alphaproteobacteria bacterium]|nr:ABC transporter ATP-binding protein [Alphaproteobacteria bacterium]